MQRLLGNGFVLERVVELPASQYGLLERELKRLQVKVNIAQQRRTQLQETTQAFRVLAHCICDGLL